MNHRRFERPRAMAGVRGSKFFYLPILPGAGEARRAGGTSCRRSSPTNRGPLSYRRVGQRPASGAPDGRSYAAPFHYAAQSPRYWAWNIPVGQAPAERSAASHGRSGCPRPRRAGLPDASRSGHEPPSGEYDSAVLAENPIRPKMGLDWTCTMVLSWIRTVYRGTIRSLRDTINLGALTKAPVKRYPSHCTYGSTSLGSRILNHGWYPQTAGNPV